MKIKSILVSQPKPKSNKNPFHDLAKKYSLKVDFRSFIHVEGVDPKDFRQQRIDMSSYSAVIFTSRMAIDHYFRIAKQTRFTVPDPPCTKSTHMYALGSPNALRATACVRTGRMRMGHA